MPDPVLPPIAGLAPTLIAAGMTEQELQDDLRPRGPGAPAPVVVPLHHVRSAYNAVRRGATVADAARVSSIPISLAQTIATEIAAVAAELADVPIGEAEPIGEGE